MAIVPNRNPEVLDAVPSDPKAPEPAPPEVEYMLLARTGQDPFTVHEPPLTLDEVIGIDHDESGQQFPDDPPEPDLGGVLMPCGKYKGKALSTIPRWYLEWAVQQSWCMGTPLGLTLVAYLAKGGQRS